MVTVVELVDSQFAALLAGVGFIVALLAALLIVQIGRGNG